MQVCYRIWLRFGFKLEDFFRRFLGLKRANELRRTLWVLNKIITPQLIAALMGGLAAPNRPWFRLKELASQEQP